MSLESRTKFIKTHLNSLSEEDLKMAESNYFRYCEAKGISLNENSSLMENAKSFYGFLLEQVYQVAESLLDDRGGERAFMQLVQMKPFMEKLNLIKGPYEKLFSKVDACLEKGHFYEMNKDWDEIENLISEI